MAQFLYPRLPYLLSLPITFSASGNTIVVPLVAARRILVYQVWFVVAGATNITFKDGASISLSGAVPMLANGTFMFETTGEPWFTTTIGNDFVINSSAAVQVSGMVYYLTTN